MAKSSGISLASFITFALFPFPASAAIIEVNTLLDDEVENGNCTLREAIQAAEADAAIDGCGAGSGADEIHLRVHGLIKLESDLPKIHDSLSFLGPGVDKLTISGSQVPGAGWDQAKYRLFRLTGTLPKTYVFRGLTLEGGLAYAGTGEQEAGGAILIAGSHDTTLEHVKIANNYSSDLGGGIYINSSNSSSPTLTLKWCTVEGNRAQNVGGGLAANNSNSTIEIKNSTFSLNESPFGGGIGLTSLGFNNNTTNIDITQSTFHGNYAFSNGFGGAIGAAENNASGQTGQILLDITSSSIISNNAYDEGGGIHVEGNGVTLAVKNNIITDNGTTNTGLEQDVFTPTGNQSTIVSNGFNFIGMSSNGFGTGNPNGNGDYVFSGSTAHGLQAFGDYGGPTMTYAPAYTSTYIVDQGNCPSQAGSYDQRGYGFFSTRIQDWPYSEPPGGNSCDIGAVEYASGSDSGPKLDYDSDTIVDENDNCMFDYNYDQADADSNDIGDVCEPVADPTNLPMSEDCDFFNIGPAIVCI